jgi:prepilin-type N-terminal cleavage/methylation domain-containing protein
MAPQPVKAETLTTSSSRSPPPGVRARLRAERGFTLVEVMVAALILVSGLLSLLAMVDIANRTTATNRVRQESDSLAREVVENARQLGYTQLLPSALAATLQPQIPGATLSGANLMVARNGYTFKVSFSACSLDDPSDGYGNHDSTPVSGGVWCPDVAANGAADSNPDDYKRLSVTVSPTGLRTTPAVQQTVLIYDRPTRGPAVSCLSTTTTCPGSNATYTSGTSQAFNVTNTALASAVQWLVNGNPPPTGQLPTGAVDPYQPSATTTTFTWNFPIADGTYSITALGFDANGNSGTRSTLQITLNRHYAIAPTTFNAGWNSQVNGVDMQWVPSVDQDILYYEVDHQYGNNAASVVASCSQVKGLTCTDSTAISPNPPAVPTCQSPPQAYTTSNLYWVVGVDTAPGGGPRVSTQLSPKIDANKCDHPPSAPAGLTSSLAGGATTLRWSPPSAPVDPDTGDSIQEWRIYRWPTGQSVQFPASRLNLIGALDSSGSWVTSFTDGGADPGGVAQSYCVTAVDTHMGESGCSNSASG